MVVGAQGEALPLLRLQHDGVREHGHVVDEFRLVEREVRSRNAMRLKTKGVRPKEVVEVRLGADEARDERCIRR